MISVNVIKDANKHTMGLSIVIDTHEDVKAFEELVHRATNLWPDAPATIKEFADQVTNSDLLEAGKKGLQVYTDSNTRVTTVQKGK